ncbi:Alpha/Beta hydrolase protein [Fusarium venenatum]|uniref:Alpha/Beta hydrolase protein n=1 Tax=Fusarium venenatum TaxID=56646 RepID=UPI001D258AC6|nr:Alpha/Beta hydrolase protein [Fusarium venenatum]
MFKMLSILHVLFLIIFVQIISAASPKASTLNGTYAGKHLSGWDQDAFLGIPYAQPPTGNLRFKWPQSLSTSFDEERMATEYGDSCMQYTQNWTMSEDCLSINIIRPAGRPKKLLPVLVWIYGGGLYAGSSADPQYNLSGIVKVSQDIKEPVLAVSFNYRLGMWGFLQNFNLLKEGNANAGLLDQRLALRWIQENIEAFGGDPERVVVWGESAGAQSIAYQMFSFDGQDEKLYRGAILESGGITGAQIHDLSYYNVAFENLTRTVGCWDKKDQLSCLRGLDEKALYAARPSLTWNPLIDGTFLKGYPSQLIREKKFVSVPSIIGANTDEGFCVGAANTTEDLFHEAFRWRNYALSAPTIRKLLELYPDDPCHQPPYHITNCSRPVGNYQGRRSCAIGGDIAMISGRRKLTELFAESDEAVYSYRFDQRWYRRPGWEGVKHFDNVAFSFQNISGLLGPSPEYDSHAELAHNIGQAYANFVTEFTNTLNNSVSGIIFIKTGQLKAGTPCVINGFIGQLSVSASDFSVLAISVTTLLTVTRYLYIPTTSKTRKTLICGAIWIMPLITSLIPTIVGEMEPVGGNWCWISSTRSDLRYGLTHGWRFFIIFITIVIYIYIWIYLRRHLGPQSKRTRQPLSYSTHNTNSVFSKGSKEMGFRVMREDNLELDTFGAFQPNIVPNSPTMFDQRRSFWNTLQRDKIEEIRDAGLETQEPHSSQQACTNVLQTNASEFPQRRGTHDVEVEIKRMMLLNGYPFIMKLSMSRISR